MDRTGGCFGATTARVRAAWKTFCELLPVLTSRSIKLYREGRSIEPVSEVCCYMHPKHGE